jgi:IgA Peptidase M64
VTTVLNNGDPANRVDLAILGDGYTAAEMSRYAAHAQQLVQALFA